MSIGAMEWVIIILVVLLLFGANKIPKLMRGMGAGIKEFKKGMAEGAPDDNPSDKAPGPGSGAPPAGSN